MMSKLIEAACIGSLTYPINAVTRPMWVADPGFSSVEKLWEALRETGYVIHNGYMYEADKDRVRVTLSDVPYADKTPAPRSKAFVTLTCPYCKRETRHESPFSSTIFHCQCGMRWAAYIEESFGTNGEKLA